MADTKVVKDPFVTYESDEPKKNRAIGLIKGLKIDENYKVDDSFVPAKSVEDCHTVHELMHFLREGKVELEAKVLGFDRVNGLSHKTMDGKSFLEAVQKNESYKLTEGVDYFATDLDTTSGSGIVGDPDFVPLVGGPFFKNLYYPYDYIRMHMASFYAYHHDPIARAVVHTLRDFTLGREWRLDIDIEGMDEKQANLVKALWDAFVEVNDLYTMMDYFAVELSVYGENFIWWLPDNATKIAYDVRPGQEPPKGDIPRIRLVDPSVFWEIVTYPEDIQRPIYYQWVAPTQYQIYTGKDGGQQVPSSKFIMQQIPADQIQHYKINCMSNEKRGRSDLFPILGYLKRLRDSVNYSIIALQKASAWAIDTSIDGGQPEIDSYVQDQQDLGPIPPAGSEFVHTTKITRNYLSNAAASGGQQSTAFEWCLNMISAGTGIPTQYFGMHVGGMSTRASAMVATEPVTKKFEMRQNIYRQALLEIAGKFFRKMGLGTIKCEVTFPDLVSQDRSAKLKDLQVAESAGWISQRRAANIAAKELGIRDFDYDSEQEEIGEQAGALDSPLTLPGLDSAVSQGKPSRDGLTGKDRRSLDKGRGA